MHLCKERNQEEVLMKVGEAKKDKRKCDYCLRTRHTKEKCWRKHGRPSMNSEEKMEIFCLMFLETTESSSQSGDTSVKGFSMEEFQALRRLITQISYYYTSSPS